LDFILWCELSDLVISLDKNHKLYYNNNKRYFVDFLVNNSTLVEIKSSSKEIYNVELEIIKIKRDMSEGNYKFITNKELYLNNKVIDNVRLSGIIFKKGNYVSKSWRHLI